MVLKTRIKQILKSKFYRDFCYFMDGQTMEIDKSGNTIIFDDDFFRWINKLKVID
jgi:hypothetical protein